MTENYNSPFSPFPVELNEDHNQQIFSLNSQASSSSSSSLTRPIFFNTAQEQGGFYYHNESQPFQHHHEEAKVLFGSQAGSLCDHRPVLVRNESDSGFKFSMWKKEEDQRSDKSPKSENTSNSVKWMSSKMRLMKKMMNTDHHQVTINNSIPKFGHEKQLSSSSETDDTTNPLFNTNNTIRVCVDCNTTKTPLWRSGPRGPKSLCNACGIRQRKARRAAMAAAAAAANGGAVVEVNKASGKSNNKLQVQQKEKKSSNDGVLLPFKKRCKLTSKARSGNKKKLCFEDLTIILSKNSAYQRVFPQDEREAAILLMALSYGLVCG